MPSIATLGHLGRGSLSGTLSWSESGQSRTGPSGCGGMAIGETLGDLVSDTEVRRKVRQNQGQQAVGGGADKAGRERGLPRISVIST